MIVIFLNGSCGEAPDSKFNSQRECGVGMVFTAAPAKLVAVQVPVCDFKLVYARYPFQPQAVCSAWHPGATFSICTPNYFTNESKLHFSCK